MSDYTPSIEELVDFWAIATPNRGMSVPERTSAAQRALAEHRPGLNERERHMAEQNYKIVPTVEKTTQEKIVDLRTFLAANVAVNIEDGDLNKAALFQQHLDLVELLVEQSRDRV